MLQVLVWLGTITFAASGALTAIGQRFDLIGVLVLASVTAVGGGAIRDVLVGRLPPASLQNETLLWVVFQGNRKVQNDLRNLSNVCLIQPTFVQEVRTSYVIH
jgi:uncharacterized membrane protein YeiH